MAINGMNLGKTDADALFEMIQRAVPGLPKQVRRLQLNIGIDEPASIYVEFYPTLPDGKMLAEIVTKRFKLTLMDEGD